MEQLTAFLKRFGRRSGARYWVGPRPEARAKALPRAIASMVGYPTSADGWTDRYDLQQIDRETAAQVLAFAATESMAYGQHGSPREGHRKLASAALESFNGDAVFLTNTADWIKGGSVTWSVTLTDATFETGLIAYDAANALIYWVEEED